MSQGSRIWCERRKSDGENECCGGGIWLWFRCGLSGLKQIPYKGLNTCNNWVIGGFDL